jgi:DNA mismatch repair ATPase MutS
MYQTYLSKKGEMKLDTQVIKDLELDTIHKYLPLKTIWGKTCFTDKLYTPSDNNEEIKQNQKQLIVFRKLPDICQKITMELDNIDQEAIQSIASNNDPFVEESLNQIFWKKDTFGSFLNTFPIVLNGLITWKTLVLPGFAIFMPIIALIVPFVFLNMTSSTSISTNDYLVHVKHVLLQQISIPSFLRSRGNTDRIGFILESLFIGLTLATFISSLWNQITSAMHLRSIWNNVKIQGRAILNLVSSCRIIIDTLKQQNIKYQRALRQLIDEGEKMLESVHCLESCDELTAFGSVWNNHDIVNTMTAWIGRIDACTSIASSTSICIPMISKKQTGVELHVDKIAHPELQTCVLNSFYSRSSEDNNVLRTHAIITGPNRGGKTTFCRGLGLAIITAQSWGFAWARRMRWTPFNTIFTALETNGVLGNMSKFESEIEFAKTVLGAKGRCFVMMDEIFHSTNATDGIAASTVFLKQLYNRGDTVSIISTHYKELATLFGSGSALANVYQMIAHEKAGGKLEYTYKMAPGISETSSVMEILAERGLMSVEPAVNESN